MVPETRSLSAMNAALSLRDPERPAILVVDDHPPNVLALEAVLEPLGLPIVSAHSGEAALVRLGERDFALILMDVHMPGLDGYQTVERLRSRERSRETPVVFLSAVYDLEEHTHRGYALGAMDYITKPFDPVAVRAKAAAIVAPYMRGRREEQQRRVEMERLKDLFLGTLGHDLRNPLNSILLAAQLGKQDSTSDQSRRQLLVIERAARRMQAMVDDILDLTAEKFIGRLPLTLEDTDLASTSRQVIDELQSAHPHRSVTLDVSGDAVGHWDGARLGRVVSNLVANALRHAGGTVHVKVVGEDACVRLTVHNEGPAIAPDLRARLFEPFRRGDTSRDGYGLGLYIVREIARAHGGDAIVDSSDAEGTTFTVSLPRTPAL
jgi:two-component system sensor histidine kinase/response regulator